MLTILGSCVATCMWDPVAQVGGLNHFLLAQSETDTSTSPRYGVHSMELLINGLLKLGAERSRLKSKVFGGARMFDGLGTIGENNAAFAQAFLNAENIPCLGGSLGGTNARKVRFWPTTGKVQQMQLSDKDQITLSRPKPTVPVQSSDDTIFF